MQADAPLPVGDEKLLQVITVLFCSAEDHSVIHLVLMDGVKAILGLQNLDGLRERFYI